MQQNLEIQVSFRANIYDIAYASRSVDINIVYHVPGQVRLGPAYIKFKILDACTQNLFF